MYNLRDTILRDIYLDGANLIRGDLRGAKLYNSFLRGINLNNADLRGVELNNSNLQGANLLKAKLDVELEEELKNDKSIIITHESYEPQEVLKVWKDIGRNNAIRKIMLNYHIKALGYADERTKGKLYELISQFYDYSKSNGLKDDSIEQSLEETK